MKSLSSGLLSSGTLCSCLKVIRADGVVSAFTTADHDVTIVDAVYGGTYLAAFGLEISNLVSQAGLAVDNMDLTVLPNETTYPHVDIIAGRWNLAAFRMFEADYTNLGLGFNLLKRGTTGEADVMRSSVKLEFRGLKQALQQNLGYVTSKTCRYLLGSTSMPWGLCMVDLTPWTHTYAATTVSSSHSLTCSAATEAVDYYGEGTATANDGPNAGYSVKVKSFAAGVFTLALPFPFPVSVGDTFTFVAGCRKRLIEDCKTKFNNVLNFGGEPDVPGTDILTADPEVST